MIEVLYVFRGGIYEDIGWKIGDSPLNGKMGAGIGFKVIGDKPISYIKFFLVAHGFVSPKAS